MEGKQAEREKEIGTERKRRKREDGKSFADKKKEEWRENRQTERKK
jgi:hypothetical protein